MFEGLVHAVLGFITQYGYLAVFIYMVLETSFLLHFVPSEVVVPFAASQLVHDPLSFVLFVIDATTGATVGSLLAYLFFRTYGREVLDRYGYVIHLSEQDLERSEAIFIRYGESSVFWGRMLPFVRALISIPAGLAEMDLERFVLYSAAGAALFNTGLTYLVYTGAKTASPLELVLEAIRTPISREIVYIQTHVKVVVVLVGVFVLILAAMWMAREWITSNPDVAKFVALHVIRLVGLITGSIFVLGALANPEHAFTVITAVWNDPLFWTQLGFSDQIALLLTGVLIALSSLIVYEIGKLIEVTRIYTLFKQIVISIRR
ncbi:VTT domain-containing protein [Haladaptatus sp. AB643]|uniref:DedA family protein n=1 Tax=Haladaptatus sp. AB643 TaxID=2934174 RepID=UPI00209BEA50|nr:DedA family protein [Haladaptatus sp. AB643]